MTTDLVAAVDIGGTKVAGALVDGNGSLRELTRLPTPAREPADRVLRTVTEVVGSLADSPLWPRVSAVGIGSAGPVDARAGTVSPVNIPAWRNFPLLSGVREVTGALPVTLVGDGAAITAGEHWRGAARGRDNVLGMVVSTGVGGGLVLDGTLRPGPTGNAGHIGHITVDLDGEPCPCGGRGCVERLASGTGIARFARRSGWQPAVDGDDSAAGVAAAAQAGDPLAQAAYARAARALAAAVATTASLVELDTVVIGGGVSQAGEVLFAPLRRALTQYATLPFVQGLDLLPAALGTEAGLVGAAAACRPSLGTFPAPCAAGN